MLGDSEKADAASRRALAEATSTKTELGLVFANIFSVMKCLFLEQHDAARDHAKAALKGAEKMKFPQWIAQANLQLARNADLIGDPAALAALQDATAKYLETGMVLARPYAQVWIAEAMIRKGAYAQALTVLDDLEAFTQTSKEQYYDGFAQKARALAAENLWQ